MHRAEAKNPVGEHLGGCRAALLLGEGKEGQKGVSHLEGTAVRLEALFQEVNRRRVAWGNQGEAACYGTD